MRNYFSLGILYSFENETKFLSGSGGSHLKFFNGPGRIDTQFLHGRDAVSLMGRTSLGCDRLAHRPLRVH